MENLIEEKRQEVKQRGLMGYPVDDADDKIRQEGIALLLNAIVEPPVIKMPHADIVVRLHPKIGAQMAYYLAVGDYEQNDLDLIDKYVREGDRVMECGGGIGVTGTMLAMKSKLPVTVVEPNPVMHRMIRDTFDLNRQVVNLIEACAVADACDSETVTFHVSPSYWWSSLIEQCDSNAMTVHARKITELLNEHQPTVLVVDIEGAEVEVLPDVIPRSVRLILMEIHTPSIGTQNTGKINARLARQGFLLRDIAAHTWVFEREN